MKNAWYEVLFRNYADRYEEESFTKGTKGEVDFIETEMKQDRSGSILDIGCTPAKAIRCTDYNP